jgi:peptide/nickel transport system permease protein
MRSFFTVPVLLSVAFLLAVLLVSVFAEQLAPHDPDTLDPASVLAAPSAEHPLGTDPSGRDLLSRLIFGARSTMLSAFLVVLISAAAGIPLGMLAGYRRGILDKVLMRLCDAVLSFPSLLLAFVLVAAFGRGIGNVVLSLGILYVPMLAKLTRSLVLVESGKLYVEAAHATGFGGAHILLREILPNIFSTLLIQLMLDVGYAILDLSAMNFIGLGVQPPTADWGAMLQSARIHVKNAPLVALSPGILIVLTVVAFNILGDGISAYLDPAQRKLPSIKRFKKALLRRDPDADPGSKVLPRTRKAGEEAAHE